MFVLFMALPHDADVKMKASVKCLILALGAGFISYFMPSYEPNNTYT